MNTEPKNFHTEGLARVRKKLIDTIYYNLNNLCSRLSYAEMIALPINSEKGDPTQRQKLHDFTATGSIGQLFTVADFDESDWKRFSIGYQEREGILLIQLGSTFGGMDLDGDIHT